MNNCVLTLCLPAFRRELWREFYESAKISCADMEFEVVFVTPHYDIPIEIQNIDNVRFLHDFGSLTKCLQLGATIAKGKFFSWPADDALFFPGALKASVDFLSQRSERDIMVGKYCEGPDYRKNPKFHDYHDGYWNVSHHFPGTPEHYKISGASIMSLSFFKEIGGVDCRYNMTGIACQDLMMRLQNIGSTAHLDSMFLLSLDHDDRPSEYRNCITEAYKTDLELFKSIYCVKFDYDRKGIDFNNWMHAPNKWGRFT